MIAGMVFILIPELIDGKKDAAGAEHPREEFGAICGK
jgi:hypothetical protein|tara:strand:+ start:71191 stop:71301 length:111 start_codon:yes stop_codon:yes gene_type:complete